MVQKQNRGYEFAIALLDSILLFIAFYCASALWRIVIMNSKFEIDDNFKQQFMMLFLAFWVTKLFSASSGSAIRKSLFDEFFSIIRTNFITLLLDTLIIFVVNQSTMVSRGTLAVTMVFSVIITCLVHMGLRSTARHRSLR